MSLAIKELDFEASVFEGTLRLRGNATGRHAELLEGLIAKLHADLVAARAPALEVDFRDLEFMTASCFNVFVTWIHLINGLTATQRYRLDFTINPEQGWQRRSLVTLSSLAEDVVRFT